MLDRFTVILINPDGNGYAHHDSSEKGELLTQLVQFKVNNPAEVTPGYGYRIPSPQIAERRPEIGTVLVGSIAHDADSGTWQMAYTATGDPFLRNWGFADQCDAAQQGNPDVGDDSDELGDEFGPAEDDLDYYDDDDGVPTNVIYGRAFAHFGNAEMAHEATSMYPGDFM